MMNFISPLHNEISTPATAYSSRDWRNSLTYPGVRFSINRISLASRLALTTRLRELLLKYDFLSAGDVLEQSEANLADLLVRRLYLEWGLGAIEGLEIDGEIATTKTLIELGPEELSDEIVAAIRAGLELSGEEIKNS